MFTNNGPRQLLLRSINMSVQTSHITEILPHNKATDIILIHTTPLPLPFTPLFKYRHQ